MKLTITHHPDTVNASVRDGQLVGTSEVFPEGPAGAVDVLSCEPTGRASFDPSTGQAITVVLAEWEGHNALVKVVERPERHAVGQARAWLWVGFTDRDGTVHTTEHALPLDGPVGYGYVTVS
jgi:hypothetical protein